MDTFKKGGFNGEKYMTGGDKTPIKSILAFWEIKENYFGAKG
jgi:hypothetical protein